MPEVTERITAAQFEAADGVEDWHVVGTGVHARFRTGTFATGVAFIDEIGRLADDMNHHPDVDLRYSTVSISLTTHDVAGLSERDIRLARAISAAARARSVDADPAPAS